MEFKKCERPLSRVYEAMMHLSLKPSYSALIFSHCLIPDFASLLTKSFSDSPCNQALSLHPLSLMYGNCGVRLTWKVLYSSVGTLFCTRSHCLSDFCIIYSKVITTLHTLNNLTSFHTVMCGVCGYVGYVMCMCV